MKYITLCFLICTSMVACNENLPDKDLSIVPDKKPTEISNAQTENTTVSTTSVDNNLAKQINLQPNGGLSQTAPTMPQNAVTPNAVPANNPPHGQPGHVCETPTTTNTTQSIQPQKNIAPQIASPVIANNAIKPAVAPATGKGLNPAHGQPGHRCDISVGAPLNSTPQKTPAPANVVANETTPQVIAAPAQINSETPASAIVNPVPVSNAKGNTGKINPAHGQPGHDCKVAVGQPLPQK